MKHQVAIHATETVKAKLTFEREDKSQGVMINKYHTDISNISKFMEELLKRKQQKLRFSAAGASHQNGAGSIARYQYNGQYGKCHIDASSDDISQGHIIHMLYESKVGFLIDSMVYKQLGKFEPFMF